MNPLDVSITGAMGLYQIQPLTKAGRTWTKKHLTSGERVRLGDTIACEGGDNCWEIVRGMVREGLRVEVNGTDMSGYGMMGDRKDET